MDGYFRKDNVWTVDKYRVLNLFIDHNKEVVKIYNGIKIHPSE
jgi:hypothetical protein